jgi:murein hydrolase activator
MFIPNEYVQGKTNREIKREKLELKDVTEEIRKKKKQLKEVKKNESRVITKLNSIERQILKEDKEYSAINKKIDRIQKQIRKTHKEIEVVKKHTLLRESYLKKRACSLYKYYRRSGLIILLSTNSYNDFFKHEKLLGDIILNDSKLFKNALINLEKRNNFKNKLQSEKDELYNAKKELSKKRAAIKHTQNQKLVLLNRIKREKKLQIKALEELKKHSEELQAFIESLPQKKQRFTSSGKKFSHMKGKLDFPVKGKIISRYGRHELPELHTFTFQKGVKIKASTGTKIRAVHDGKVVYSDWFKGYGYMLIIDHGESYYSLSAHASKLFKSVGEIVYAGEIIALVGDTSSINGACLYFEIRHHGKTKNPLRWLKKNGNKT